MVLYKFIESSIDSEVQDSLDSSWTRQRCLGSYEHVSGSIYYKSYIDDEFAGVFIIYPLSTEVAEVHIATLPNVFGIRNVELSLAFIKFQPYQTLLAICRTDNSLAKQLIMKCHFKIRTIDEDNMITVFEWSK